MIEQSNLMKEKNNKIEKTVHLESTENQFFELPLQLILEKYPFAEDYLLSFNLDYKPENSLKCNIQDLSEDYFKEIKMTKEELLQDFVSYIDGVSRLIDEKKEEIDTISILPGKNKERTKEEFHEIILKKGEVIALVGQTGSGKSRLLEDIEWCANGDTPTERIILINNKIAKRNHVGKKKKKLIAQLSQNMNFVLDMTVREFLQMHVSCFHTENEEALIENVYDVANQLAGEHFDIDISVTGLSGGQSRALMIADCAILSVAPIILIDEIENAGINRRKALELLTGEEKIVVVATHDPVLALLADKRLIIDNGGITKIIEKNEKEIKVLEEAENLDNKLIRMREELRQGKILETI